jgi:Fe-S-cluster containining protein
MEELDCLTCGACCFQRPGTILVTAADIVRLSARGRSGVVEGLVEGHFGERAFPVGPSGACAHHGRPGAPHECQIYEDRADVCRDFEVGSQQCLEFRREGIHRRVGTHRDAASGAPR